MISVFDIPVSELTAYIYGPETSQHLEFCNSKMIILHQETG